MTSVLGSTDVILASWRTTASSLLRQSHTTAVWAALTPTASLAKGLNAHLIFLRNRGGDVPIRATSMVKIRGEYDDNGDTTGWLLTAYRRSFLAGHLCQRGAGRR